MLDLLHLDHLRFLQDFDRIEALVVLRLDEMYSSEAARAERSLHRKVLEGVFTLCRPHGVDGAAIRSFVRVIAAVEEVLDGGYVLLIVGGSRRGVSGGHRSVGLR